MRHTVTPHGCEPCAFGTFIDSNAGNKKSTRLRDKRLMWTQVGGEGLEPTTSRM